MIVLIIEYLSSGFSTRLNLDQPVQLHKKARGLEILDIKQDIILFGQRTA